MTAKQVNTGTAPEPVVLVVDDEPPNRDLLAHLLRSQGYGVLTAGDGVSALSAIRAGGVGLVLVDIMMPRMDGIEVCQAIRRDLKLPNLPVVFITSLSDRESRVRAKEAGADDYLVKPIDTLELLIRVENLWKLRQYYELVERHNSLLGEELQRATERLLHVERLSTVGSLAAGVGHELGNLAGIFRGSLELIRQSLASGSPVDPREVAKLERVMAHLDHHAAQLLKLGHSGGEEDRGLDLSKVVSGVVELLRGTGRAKHANIALKLPEHAPHVRMARARLEQVLFNLILNALDALRGVEGRERVVTVTVEARDALERTRVLVMDNGVGIDEADLGRVFEPYFTTKPIDQATGLGLTLVRQTVESVGGRVVLISRKGEGTTAIVDFPALREEARDSERDAHGA